MNPFDRVGSCRRCGAPVWRLVARFGISTPKRPSCRCHLPRRPPPQLTREQALAAIDVLEGRA